MESVLINNCLQALREGKTILYPTDTIWGIGCDSSNAKAIDRIYSIKERDYTKSMLVLVTTKMLSDRLNKKVLELLLHSEKPTTMIIPKQMLKNPIADNLPAQDGTVGVRVPKFDFCQKLLNNFEHPIVSTSANLSGHPSPNSYADIEAEIKQRVDYVLPNQPGFEHKNVRSSRILKLNEDGQIVVIRASK